MSEALKWLNLDEKAIFPLGFPLLQENIYFAQSKNIQGQFLLVAEFDSRVDVKALPLIKGIKIELLDQINNCILILTLEDSGKIETFARFCDHLARATVGLQAESLVLKTISLIKDYSRIFSSAHDGMDTRIQTGMLGELYALHTHLIDHLGTSLSIRAWIGPDGSKVDFVADDFCLEVKAHRKGFTDTITISSIEQLDSPYRDKFFIYKIDLSPSEISNSISLNSLKSSIMILLRNDSGASDQFIEHFDELTKDATDLQLTEKFKVELETVFNVTDDFPRIRSQDLHSSILQDIEYKIDVSDLDNFIIQKPLSDIISSE
ncbi:PD-(D/E)XK motif protein [Gammaproteobacteria bacterium]|nr:PD-(D/E)XK motif protein [Gammaproteobacteria bacterium]